MVPRGLPVSAQIESYFCCINDSLCISARQDKHVRTVFSAAAMVGARAQIKLYVQNPDERRADPVVHGSNRAEHCENQILGYVIEFIDRCMWRYPRSMFPYFDLRTVIEAIRVRRTVALQARSDQQIHLLQYVTAKHK